MRRAWDGKARKEMKAFHAFLLSSSPERAKLSGEGQSEHQEAPGQRWAPRLPLSAQGLGPRRTPGSAVSPAQPASLGEASPPHFLSQ